MSGDGGKGGGAGKYGRNKQWCTAYRARGQRDVNKARRILREYRHALRKGATWHAETVRAALKSLPASAVRDACARLAWVSDWRSLVA